ncbi:MAG: hypothetical protein M3Q33_08390 [Acidobacteriota bacterium]|nr:hypothetical protein [Acidobacteriota bacterium]
MDLDGWKIKEALEALEKKKHFEKSYGIDLTEMSENFSSLNQISSLNETVKALCLLTQIPKLDFSLPKFDIPKIEFKVPSIFNESNFLTLSKSLTQELSQVNFISKNFLKNDSVENFSRQYKSLIKSNLNTAVLITSFRNEELDLLKNLKFELPQFPKINLPQQSLRELARMLNQNKVWESIELLRNTYVGNLAISMREAIVNSSNNEEAIRKIESLYEEKIASLPQNKFSREFILGSFLAISLWIISMWYSHYLAQQSSVELQTLFKEVSSRIEKSNLDDDIIEEGEVYYIVQRTMCVKNSPDFKCLTIDYLSSDTKVRSLKSKHKWIYIEYIDYLEIVPRYGWVNKKYLKRLEK